MIYSVLSNGKHPFGKTLRRECNILDFKPCFTWKHLKIEHYPLLFLVNSMINPHPHKRPQAKNALKFIHFIQDLPPPDAEAIIPSELLEKISLPDVEECGRFLKNSIDMFLKLRVEETDESIKFKVSWDAVLNFLVNEKLCLASLSNVSEHSQSTNILPDIWIDKYYGILRLLAFESVLISSFAAIKELAAIMETYFPTRVMEFYKSISSPSNFPLSCNIPAQKSTQYHYYQEDKTSLIGENLSDHGTELEEKHTCESAQFISYQRIKLKCAERVPYTFKYMP